MKIKGLLSKVLLLIGFCGVVMSTGQAQDKFRPGTKKGFVTTSDGVKIHYFEAGPKAVRRSPTLLFVPGWMTPGWIWEYQLAHFAKDYRVVAMDPRSQGESAKPADGHYPAARARDIKSLVDQLELTPVVLAASSSGVTEAASYVDQFGTETLAGLVLVNGIAGRDYDEATITGLLAFTNSFQLDRQKAADRFVRGLYKKPRSEDYLRRMIQATLRMPTNSAVALILGGIASDNRTALAKIDRPTLIVVAMVRPWMQFYEDLQKRIRGSRMEVFEDAGHALFVDEAARFNVLLDGFLNNLPREQPDFTGNNMFPQWSHDGKRIVFTSDRDGDPEIYAMNADGSNPARLTRMTGRDAHPYFSRDGRTIVFQSPRANGEDTNIYVMNSDGSNVVQLTNLKGFAGVPVYSPDEKLIVLQWRETNNFDDDKKWRICVTNADGSNFRTITSGEANDQVPNWSRDGERLLFYSDRSGKNQIYTMKPDGSEVRQLVATRSDDNAAFWSPDNKKITFTSDRDGNSELYVMDADGKHVRRLTNTRATERAGVWSPDGKRIAFSSDGDGPSHVYLMNADGSKLMSLTGKAK